MQRPYTKVRAVICQFTNPCRVWKLIQTLDLTRWQSVAYCCPFPVVPTHSSIPTTIPEEALASAPIPI
eukprot:345280-Pleurochrysis_carterae.AAC.2